MVNQILLSIQTQRAIFSTTPCGQLTDVLKSTLRVAKRIFWLNGARQRYLKTGRFHLQASNVNVVGIRRHVVYRRYVVYRRKPVWTSYVNRVRFIYYLHRRNAHHVIFCRLGWLDEFSARSADNADDALNWHLRNCFFFIRWFLRASWLGFFLLRVTKPNGLQVDSEFFIFDKTIIHRD